MSRAVLDLVWGFIAFAMVLAVSFITREHQDIRSFLLATCVAFFAAALLRTNPRRGRLWLTVLLVALGGIVPVVTMNRLGIAFTAQPFIVSFLVLSVCSIILGIGIRWLNARAGTRYATAVGCLSTIAILAAVFVAIPRWIESGAYRSVNQNTPPFSIETLTGKKLYSEDWKGRVLGPLSFWATWCTPCETELPEIAALQAKYRDNPNVLIFALNSGNHGETPAKAQAYLTKREPDAQPSHRFVLPPIRRLLGPAAKSLGVTSLPALYIVDCSGQKTENHHLGFDWSEQLSKSLSRRIDELL